MADPSPDPGAVRGKRLGRYTLVRSLGAGGMAELFLARADGLGGFSKLVAIKRILPHKATNERFVRMLLNEARLVASLDHPNIAHVLDVDFDQGQYFFAMEYVHGHDLHRILHTQPRYQLQLENVLHVGIGVCAGLHHAHEARDASGASLGIVHRDVSPSNVLVSYEGAVKLVDFGVAKAASVVSETREGIIKGKYGYMSPEQCLGEPLDRRSDLFSVGIMLWEMATGRRLYKINGELATLQRVVYVDAPRPSRYAPDIPPALERIIMRALERDPKKRYATAQQIQLELETFAVEHRIPVSPVSMSLEMRRLFRGRIDAWREAEAAGLSLADHLAAVSSEDPIHDADEAVGIDDVLADLDTSLFSLDARDTPTAVERPSAPQVASRTNEPREIVAPISAPARAPASDVDRDARSQASAAAQVRSRAPLALASVVTVGMAAAAVYMFVVRSPGKSADAAHPATIAHASADAAAAPEPVVAVPDAAVPTVEIAAIEPDAAEPDAAEPDAAAPEPPAPVEANPRDQRASSPPPKRDRPTKVTSHRSDPEPDHAKQTTTTATLEPPRPPIDAGVAVVIVPKGPAPGTVDATKVRAVVRSHLGQIQECVSRARMDNRDLKGRVVMRIEIAPTGHVTSASVASSTGATSGLESCMAKAVARWTFPAPAGGTKATISYPFAF